MLDREPEWKQFGKPATKERLQEIINDAQTTLAGEKTCVLGIAPVNGGDIDDRP